MTKDELVEKVAREIAPELEGGRMFDQMPQDRLSLRKWAREGMCGFNDATREDAVATARAALAIAMPAAFEMAAEVAEKRAEARFADFGTTEPDTNASYYSGRRGEALDELDEEDGDIAKALRELKEKWK